MKLAVVVVGQARSFLLEKQLWERWVSILQNTKDVCMFACVNVDNDPAIQLLRQHKFIQPEVSNQLYVAACMVILC